MTTALLERLIHRRHILETGNDSFRFKASAAIAAQEKTEGNEVLTQAQHLKHRIKVAHFSMKNSVTSAWKSTNTSMGSTIHAAAATQHWVGKAPPPSNERWPKRVLGAEQRRDGFRLIKRLLFHLFDCLSLPEYNV